MFFSLRQRNTDSINGVSTTHPVDMLERQEKNFIFCPFSIKRQYNPSLCLRDMDVGGGIREHSFPSAERKRKE